MKNIIMTFIVLALVTSISYPQKMRDRMKPNRGKLEQLEKIKLIEALDLDEETAIRFFARRNELKKMIEKLEDKSDDLLLRLEKTFTTEDKNTAETQKQLISDFLKTRDAVEANRNQFINSLYDILTTQQISKLIVFEKKFRDEIRNVLLDKKRP